MCLLGVGWIPRLHGQVGIGQSGGPRPVLPPIVYVYPMVGDEEVLEDKAGSCPKCRMTLKAVRLVAKYSCPIHPTQQVEDGPGRCRIDGRDLVPVTLSMIWGCSGLEQDFLEPGVCADGKARRARYEVRAHGDHNPRHGGQFFMAQDAWHHLEGTLQPGGVFRLFFYDNDLSTVGLYFTEEPLSGNALREVTILTAIGDRQAQQPVSFHDTLRIGGHVVAIRPSLDRVYTTLTVDAVLPSNRRVVLLTLRNARPEWARRYWLEDPIEVPVGTRIEVPGVARDDQPDGQGGLQVSLDISPF